MNFNEQPLRMSRQSLQQVASNRWPVMSKTMRISDRAIAYGCPVFCTEGAVKEYLDSQTCCHWCRCVWDGRRGKRMSLFVSLVHGGPYSLANMVACCTSCKIRKANTPVGAADFPLNYEANADEAKLQMVLKEMGVLREDWSWRTAPANRLESRLVLDTFFKGMFVLGWTGYSRPMTEFVKLKEGTVTILKHFL